MNEELLNRIRAFIDPTNRAAENPRGGWPDVPVADMRELYVLVEAMINARFPGDEYDSPPVSVLLTDKKRFEPPCDLLIPRYTDGYDPMDLLEAMSRAVACMHYYSDRVRTIQQLLDLEKEHLTPKVGVGTFIVRHIPNNPEPRVLLSQRKVKFGEGQWSLPGGHVELYQGLAQAAAREIMEETGLTVNAEDLVNVGLNEESNREMGKHYITVYFMTTKFEGTPENREPEKHGDWVWHPLVNLPAKSWLGIRRCAKQVIKILGERNAEDQPQPAGTRP